MSIDTALLLECARPDGRAPIISTLERFGHGAIAFAHAAGIRIVGLARGERYDARSPSLARLGVDVDAWCAPPAGLFVVEERTVYLRSYSPMTVAHEFGHALDCALGNGVYHSGIDPHLRELFAQARGYVTPYAATAPDEYFAEGLRAFVECNDPNSFWPQATKTRLRRIDPELFAYVERLFALHFHAGA